MAFDYANLSSEKLKEIEELESKLNVVLIAYDSKYSDEVQA